MKQNRDTIKYSKHTIYLIGSILIGVLLYVYFLNDSVVSVVIQKEKIREIQVLKNEIAALEADYIEAQHTISASMATIEGMAAEKNKIFVSRNNSNNLVLSR